MEQLLEQLKNTDETIRYDAAQQLGKDGDARAVDGLVNILNDENPKVKYAALSSLVKIGSTTAATPTISALLEDTDSRLWKLLTLDIGMRLRNGLFDMIEPENTEVADMLHEAMERDDLSE
ncbi:MAG: HEAT repeat domain-containing protein, partial [Chloroflexota bacterium]